MYNATGNQLLKSGRDIKIGDHFADNFECVLHTGDARDLLRQIPDGLVQLVVTSPPYNIGKEYEKSIPLEEYICQQEQVIGECVRILKEGGSICWQVGNYVHKNEIVPLDIMLYPLFAKFGLKLRNRIVWHFEHGLHCSKRLSGRHETILWFTKGDEYAFNLDAIRVPQKYPAKKYFKGARRGQLSGNPLGKNPGDVWLIPNVKHNHPEKTVHPCQFPIELIERLVLALTKKGDWAVDPFIGVGTTAIAALLHERKSAGADIVPEYIQIANERIEHMRTGLLKRRPMGKPVYTPSVSPMAYPLQTVVENTEVSPQEIMHY